MDPHAPPAPAAPSAAPRPAIPNQGLAIAMLVCAGLLLVALFSKSWVSWAEGGREHGSIGPMGAEFCERDMCTGIPWSVLESKRVSMSGDISVLGTLSILAGLAAAAAAGLCGAMILSRKPDKIPLKPVQAALGTAAGLMTLFAIRLLTESIKIKLGLSWGTVVGLGAVIAAAVIYQVKLRPWLATIPRALPSPGGAQAIAYGQAQPGHGQPQGYGQPQPGYGQQPQPQTHPCPRCQRPLVFVAQYQRWFCEGCRDYV